MTTTAPIPNAGPTGANPLKCLLEYGQSPWMDYIRRNILLNGDLNKMISSDGLPGMTSNPSTFENAITGGDDYNDILNDKANASLNPKGIYEKIAIRDVQDAADIFRPVYESTNRKDGYVS